MWIFYFFYLLRYFFIKRKLVKYETVTFEDPRTGQLYSSQKLLGAHQFLTEYAKQFGEDQPDSSDVHLPSCVTKPSVYEDYQLQCQTNSKPYIKISRFYEMWISEFQHVKLRKVNLLIFWSVLLLVYQYVLLFSFVFSSMYSG